MGFTNNGKITPDDLEHGRAVDVLRGNYTALINLLSRHAPQYVEPIGKKPQVSENRV